MTLTEFRAAHHLPRFLTYHEAMEIARSYLPEITSPQHDVTLNWAFCSGAHVTTLSLYLSLRDADAL